MNTDSVSRRKFLQVGGATVALGVGMAMTSGVAGAAPDQVTTYALDPVGGGSSCRRGHDCAACNACRVHAANKVFRTAAAANTGRAHTACRCTVITGVQVDAAVAATLFANGDSVDRRTPEVARLLGPGGVHTDPVPIIAGAAPVVLLAGGGAAYWWTRRRHAAAADAAPSSDISV